MIIISEAIYAGGMQERHPNPCRLAPSGYYGSKFVTVVVTGNDKGEIDFRGYQISNQVDISFPMGHMQWK